MAGNYVSGPEAGNPRQLSSGETLREWEVDARDVAHMGGETPQDGAAPGKDRLALGYPETVQPW